MIINLQRRIQEAGRIRIGQQVQSGDGKSRPAKLDTFRLTSADRQRIQEAAQLYGGTPAQWDAPAGRQWEVITGSDALPVIVPPSEMAFSQHYEQWSAGGCQRRCDGATESISDRPCVCDPDARDCAIHTRLSVMLRDLCGLGVWRIDTSGYYAAVELQGAVQVIQAAASRRAMLPARLRLEQRSVKRIDRDGKAQTRRFAVPVLDIEISPAQLLGGQVGEMSMPALAIAQPQLDPPAPPAPPAVARGFTPVPAELPVGPGRSVAEQSAPPPPKPKRRNAAPEIPRSGRQRDVTTSSVVELAAAPEDRDGERKSSTAQNRMMHALFREADLGGDDNRGGRLRLTGLILGREVDTSAGLSTADAARVIDRLTSYKTDGDLADAAARAQEDAALAEMEALGGTEVVDRPDDQASA